MTEVVGRAKRWLRRLSEARERDGARGVVTAGLRLVRRVIELPFVLVAEWATDVWLGVRTRKTTHGEAALAPVSIGGDPRPYQAIRLPYWRRIMDAIPLDPTESTFVDLGCGRGRALVLAARSGFSSVVGVELDESLARDAEANLSRWSGRIRARGRPVPEHRVLHLDAAAYIPPSDGPLAVFLFNSFGSETLRRVLDTLRRSRSAGAETYFAYCNPQDERVFAEQEQFVRHAGGPNWVVYRLTAAQAAGGSSLGN